jgi:predicted component of type VI protein secretion system
MRDLNKFFWLAGAIILVDVPGLELVWTNDLLERLGQSTETAPPSQGDISRQRTSMLLEHGNRPSKSG